MTTPNPIPKVLLSSTTIPDQNITNPQPDQWGFVLYRTTYSSEEKWQAAKTKLCEIVRADIEGLNDADHGQPRGSNETATIKFVENEVALGGLTAEEVRKIHNPNYRRRGPEESDEEFDKIDRGAPLRADQLCDEVCLMVDEASMESILKHGDDDQKPGYVVAIDVLTEESESLREWDGTIMVHVESIFGELYCRNVGDNTLIMGEFHPRMGEIWDFGAGFYS